MSHQTGIKAEKGHIFFIRPLDRVPSFTVVSGGRFPCIPMESLLVEVDVMSRQTGIKAEKGRKF